jgi:hypothetical protein
MISWAVEVKVKNEIENRNPAKAGQVMYFILIFVVIKTGLYLKIRSPRPG